MQAGQALAADRNQLIANLDREQIVKFLIAAELDGRAGNKALELPATQPLGVVVLHLPDNDALTGAKGTQRLELPADKGAVAAGDGMAVRIFEWLAKVSGD